MEERKEALSDVGEFIADYSAHMMGCGIHTARVVRSAKRIGTAFGYEVHLSVFQKNIILTLQDKEGHEYFNEVVDVPALPISFEHNASLSALSWDALDDGLSLHELKLRYQEIVTSKPLNPNLILLLASLANGAFCKLFGGDWVSCLIVFLATMVGFFLRQQLTRRAVNHYIVFMISAFVASLIASSAQFFTSDSSIALATSVLYLVPGVPLINGVIDIIDGQTSTGFSRLTHSALLIICIAIGLAATLFIVKNALI